MAKRRKAANRRRTEKAASGFHAVAFHATEPEGQAAFRALTDERPFIAAFALKDAQPSKLDPQSAAKRILHHALASKAMPTLTAPKVGASESEFKSLGVETVPLTRTTFVKFRQLVKGIPVYGSLVTVELGKANECVSLNSNLGTPEVRNHVAKISPRQALETVAAKAGYGRTLPNVTPALYYYHAGANWHLAYIMENVRVRKHRKPHAPLVFDYVVDAMSGSLLTELARTPYMRAATLSEMDELGRVRKIGIDVERTTTILRDPSLNVETYDFGGRDPAQQHAALPGVIFGSSHPLTPAAVSAHSNAAAVATFLRNILRRNNIDDNGTRIVSSVNCLRKSEERPLNSGIWFNALWDPILQQMVYGQAKCNGKLRSVAAALDVVAHELFHGVTGHTARLEYALESGALNESYSDIFGVIIANFSEADIGKWTWRIGHDLVRRNGAIRDLQHPGRYRQRQHMKRFLRIRRDRAHDYGGVHENSGIHNFAAYSVMTARDASKRFLFSAAELAAMFYIGLTQHLSRQSGFVDSRRGILLATRSLFRERSPGALARRVAAVEAGFDAAGIH